VQLDDEVSLAPGRTVDIRFALPQAVCDDTPLRRTVTLEQAHGIRMVVDLTGADDFTAGLHERECLMADIARTATLAWTGFTPSPPGKPAHAALSITPAGAADAVRLGGIQSTNLLQFAPRHGDRWALDLTLDGGADAVLEVPLVPQRCDPHVVQEDKRGTVFTIEVEEPRVGTIELAMPAELKARVLTWVGEWCEFGK
jgi:hypothetical protein